MPQPPAASGQGKVVLPSGLKKFIDLNMDYGQSQDVNPDSPEMLELLDIVSSVNIPCAVHDGNPKTIKDAIAIAKANHCAIGAHIGYPDPKNQGYKDMDISIEELQAWVYVQMGAFKALVQSEGREIEHVRPHGAMYSKFVNDFKTGCAIAEVLKDINPWTILVGPAGPMLEKIAEETGIRTAPEVYLGKRYDAEGTIMLSRFHEMMAPQAIMDQAKQLIDESTLTAVDGKPVPVAFKTLHLSNKIAKAKDVAEHISKLLIQPVSLPVAAVGESGWL